MIIPEGSQAKRQENPRPRTFQRKNHLRSRLADAPRQGRPPSALGIVDPLIAEVIDIDPRELGYHSTVWTAPLLREYLEQVHGIAVSRKSMSLAIARLRMRWKRPRHQLSLRPETWRQSKGG
jgi:transposase